MDAELAALPDDIDALRAALLAARADVAQVTAEAAAALAEKSSNLALIAHLKLQIEELEASATEDELAAETACPSWARTSPRPSRSFPAGGKSSSVCARSSPAGIASASASPLRRST